MIKVILSYRKAIIKTQVARTDWGATPLRLRLWESCGIDGLLHLAGWSLQGTLRAYRSKRGHRSSKSGWWWCLQSSHWPRSSPGPGRNWSTYWGLDERTVCEQAFIYLPPQHDLLDRRVGDSLTKISSRLWYLTILSRSRQTRLGMLDKQKPTTLQIPDWSHPTRRGLNPDSINLNTSYTRWTESRNQIHPPCINEGTESSKDTSDKWARDAPHLTRHSDNFVRRLGMMDNHNNLYFPVSLIDEDAYFKSRTRRCPIGTADRLVKGPMDNDVTISNRTCTYLQAIRRKKNRSRETSYKINCGGWIWFHLSLPKKTGHD